MDFGLTSEQQMLVDSIRAFVEAELKPYEEEVERTNKVRPELIQQIHAAARDANGCWRSRSSRSFAPASPISCRAA